MQPSTQRPVSDALRLLKRNKPVSSRLSTVPPSTVCPLEDTGPSTSSLFVPPPPTEPHPEQQTIGRLDERGTAGVHGRSRTRQVLRWGCDDCGRECVPVRDESRCLCGHRLREHRKLPEEQGSTGSASTVFY